MLSEARRAIASFASSAVLVLALVENAVAAASLRPLPPQPSDVPWPDANWPSGPLPASVDAARLEHALAVVATAHPTLGETRAVVVIEGGGSSSNVICTDLDPTLRSSRGRWRNR
jgi:hypothetical protein